MALVGIKKLLEEAGRTKGCVGAFNVSNMEMVMGAVKAAEEMETGIILQIAEGRLKYSPLDYIGPIMVSAADNAKVDIAVQFDHGKTLPLIEKSLELGFSSVMIDGSDLAIEDNIKLSNIVRKKASYYGVDMEAEVGTIGGNEGDGTKNVKYTDPDDVKDFLDNVDVDALAIAIGNAHGRYRGKPELNFEILEMIADMTDVPLVLHGGSGISDDDFRKAIRNGIRKINIGTASFESVVKGVESLIEEEADPGFFDLSDRMVKSTYENVKRHLKVFSSAWSNE